METVMAAAAVTEIFLASVAIATLLAVLALRGAFWMMRGTDHRFTWPVLGRSRMAAHLAVSSGELAPAQAATGAHRVR
jgi:hypothetical protein